jgi:hypothetical protein
VNDFTAKAYTAQRKDLYIVNREDAEKTLKYLLPRKTRRAQMKALLLFFNFAHFCVLCGRKIFSASLR